MTAIMSAIERDTRVRRMARRALVLVGLAMLVLAAGLDSADAATGAAADSDGLWVILAGLAALLFAIARWANPARTRRLADARRRRPVARVRRR